MTALGLARGTRPARDSLARAWSHGVGKEVVVDGGHPVPETAIVDGTGLNELFAHLRHGSTLAAAIRTALAPNRWDDWTNYNDHRPYPSPRAKHAHRVWLDLGDGARQLDEVRCTVGAVSTAGNGATGVAVRVLVRGAVERIPAGYGAMREALALLEVGHVTESILGAARAQGVRAAWHPEPEHGGTVVELGVPTGPARRARVDRRCSGLDPRGLAADPRPLSARRFAKLVAAAPVTGGGLNHRLAVHNVVDHPDGVWQSAPHGLVPEQPGPAGAHVAGSFRGPPGVIDLAAINTIWGISTSLTDEVGRRPDAYGELLIRTGMAGQQVCAAAASAGLFCRPVRGFDEPDLEAVLGLPPNEDLLYALLIGVPRVTGFTYDLTVPEPDYAQQHAGRTS